MASSREINDTLSHYVRPSTFPVGVLPLRRAEDAPPELLRKAKAPIRDLGQTITVCMGVEWPAATGGPCWSSARTMSARSAESPWDSSRPGSWMKIGQIANSLLVSFALI